MANAKPTPSNAPSPTGQAAVLAASAKRAGATTPATPAAQAAAAAMALPAASIAVAPGTRGAALLHCANPTATYGVRVPNPANPASTLVLPFTLPPQAAKLHPNGCYVVVRPQVGWLGQDGVPAHRVRWHVTPSPWHGMATVAYPGSMASNPAVAYVVRPYSAGLTVHGAAQQPCPTA